MELVKLAIYVLCLLTSAACAYLLIRGYRQSGARLLFWSGLCFVFLAGNSLAVMVDIFAQINLQMLRHACSLAAVGMLLVGLVWESE